MMSEGARLPPWVRLTDHPVVVRTCHGTTGTMSFEGASPHLVGDNRELFLGALRRDISACDIEPARKVFRTIPHDDPVLAPETCTPYVEANSLGYYVKNVLPVVFVRTTHGDLLPNARVALKYLRENEKKFSDVLDMLACHAPAIFEPGAYAALRPVHPELFSDVAQPYAAFSNRHMAMGAGCYAMTPAGIATVVGPPINQRSVLPLHSGLMESEFHHSELFLVFDLPEFSERVAVLEPGTVLAQVFFVAHKAHEKSEVRFSTSDLGAEPHYRERSMAAGLELLETGRPFVLSTMTGVMSISVSCPHCWVSVTAAAEGGVAEDHRAIQDFYQGYKTLRAEYHRFLRDKRPIRAGPVQRS